MRNNNIISDANRRRVSETTKSPPKRRGKYAVILSLTKLRAVSR